MLLSAAIWLVKMRRERASIDASVLKLSLVDWILVGAIVMTVATTIFTSAFVKHKLIGTPAAEIIIITSGFSFIIAMLVLGLRLVVSGLRD